MKNKLVSDEPTFEFDYSVFEEPISPENVQRMGELIALRALKTVCRYSHKSLDRLYRCLVRDVYRSAEEGHVYSDGYDYVQTAILFLCQHFGKKVGDVLFTRKDGKVITIKHACYLEVNRYIVNQRDMNYYTVSIHDLDRHEEPSIDFTLESETDYSNVDNIIESMHLDQGQTETLNCYMGGMTFVEIANFLSVNLSTVWRRRQKIQQKYMALMGRYGD